MSPFKSSAGRALGKLLEGYQTSTLGQGFGSSSSTAVAVLQATGGAVAGGSVYTINGTTYIYHYFKEPGTFNIPDANNFSQNIDVLVIAGGGAGGARSGGGGGAGGIAIGEGIPLAGLSGALSIPITVGPGGPQPAAGESGNAGQDSRFGDAPNPYNVFALGGGGGGGDNGQSGKNGGSGGGGHYNFAGASGNQPTQNPGKSWVTNYGNSGSAGWPAPEHQSGAGGGAGGAAGAGGPNNRGSAGDGLYLPQWNVSYYMPSSDPYWPGISPLPKTHFGGGGGAGDYPPFIPQNMPSNAINGGGGAGGPSGGAASGTPGKNGLGAGGGGGTGDAPGPLGGAGGNGMVVVRYKQIVIV